jgi:hypothetical protein
MVVNRLVGGGSGGMLGFGPWVNQQLRTSGIAHMPAYSAYAESYQAGLARRERASARKQAERLIGEYQTAYNEAKAANLQRYEEILAGYGTRYNEAQAALGQTRTAITGKLASNRAEVLSDLQGLGEKELAGIGRRYTKERASASQGLISSGLHSTTVAPAVLGGVTRREGYAVAEAQERLRREKLGYISQLGAQELQSLKELSSQELMAKTGLKKEELDFMERREDEYPSESLYVQLMQGLGSS